jgi:opacity protein-like surface antigen
MATAGCSSGARLTFCATANELPDIGGWPPVAAAPDPAASIPARTARHHGTRHHPTNGGVTNFSITNSFGHSQINTGWTVGYGTEGQIDFWGSRNWTWKIEGLYIDLGTLDTTSVTSGVFLNGPTFDSVTGGQVTTHTHFTEGILRAGL